MQPVGLACVSSTQRASSASWDPTCVARLTTAAAVSSARPSRVRSVKGHRGPDGSPHAAEPGAWIGRFDEFTDLLADWGRVLTEADRRGWGVVGLSE
ncbi:hypothetical protein [Streptomyces sp. NBC_00316]|uniref:hypothetical protein n=1 Tax=Streptomyces sp. NBC_00316 TaxID=2975710 RepID=UPI002E2C3878|nr:hypothetical protein [Streptomyces sp. NBC_00316]